VTQLAAALAKRLQLTTAVAGQVQQGLIQACSMINSRATDANESCNVLMVGDQDKFQVGFVGHGNALNFRPDDPGLKAIQGCMDEVKHQVLPTRGYLLTMVKRVR
jgi:hypothetical protein